jgi:sulfonate transport system permease protein
MRRWHKTFIGLLFLIAIVATWEVLGRSGVISPLYLPAPSSLLSAYRPQLGYGMLLTITRAVVGYVIGLAIAYFVHFCCVAAGWSEQLDTQFTGARAIPVVSVLPLFVIWFGFSETGRLLAVILATIAFFIAPVHEAYRLLPRQWEMLRKQIPLAILQYYMRVALPGGLASLAAAFRITFAIAFTIAIASEYVGAQYGIGKFLDSARITFNIPAIILTIILCSIVGVILDRLIVQIYRKTVYWAGKQPKL